jgi:hypothetical protein
VLAGVAPVEVVRLTHADIRNAERNPDRNADRWRELLP